jgi:hypothetical protein
MMAKVAIRFLSTITIGDSKARMKRSALGLAAHPGRHLQTLQDDRGGGRFAAHHLQYPRAHHCNIASETFARLSESAQPLGEAIGYGKVA